MHSTVTNEGETWENENECAMNTLSIRYTQPANCIADVNVDVDSHAEAGAGAVP